VFSRVFYGQKKIIKIVFTTSLTKRGDFAPKNSFYHSTNFSNNATNIDIPLTGPDDDRDSTCLYASLGLADAHVIGNNKIVNRTS